MLYLRLRQRLPATGPRIAPGGFWPCARRGRRATAHGLHRGPLQRRPFRLLSTAEAPPPSRSRKTRHQAPASAALFHHTRTARSGKTRPQTSLVGPCSARPPSPTHLKRRLQRAVCVCYTADSVRGPVVEAARDFQSAAWDYSVLWLVGAREEVACK